MNEYKLGIYIAWYNSTHDDKITKDDVWLEHGYIKDLNNYKYKVLSTKDIEDLKVSTTNDYADEIKSSIDYVLRQSNMKEYSKYILIDKKLIYNEFNQYNTRMLTNCKDWLAQEYPYEGELYDIIQI